MTPYDSIIVSRFGVSFCVSAALIVTRKRCPPSARYVLTFWTSSVVKSESGEKIISILQSLGMSALKRLIDSESRFAFEMASVMAVLMSSSL